MRLRDTDFCDVDLSGRVGHRGMLFVAGGLGVCDGLRARI